MAESRFIKTVTFGGFDRSDVIKRMEFLNSQIYDLKNELRETKLLMEDLKKGTPEEKSFDNVLTTERNKLNEFQVKYETANTNLKAATQDIKTKDEEIAALRQNVEALTKELDEAKSKLSAFEAGNDPMAISQVFVQAQMSSNQLMEGAKADAEKVKKEANKAVEEIINDANNSAAQIIYEAERDAAQKLADAQNKSEEMDAASNNLRATVLQDVNKLTESIAAIRSVFSDGSATVERSEKLLANTKAVLEDGGVPVFKIPNTVSPELPEPPVPKKLKREEKKSDFISGLDTLDELTSAVLKDEDPGAAPAKKPKDKDKSAKFDSSELDALLKESNDLLG